MRPLKIGEFMRVIMPPLVNHAFGVSFIEIGGSRSTYWAIRDTTGRFVTFATVGYL